MTADWTNEMKNRVSEAIAAAQRAGGCYPDGEPCGGDGGCTARPRYVIINETDAPSPSMVCQWVPGTGYCYMERLGTKPRHDGMTGREATPVEAFGFTWVEDADGITRFYYADQPSKATYRDGQHRKWQGYLGGFEFSTLGGAVGGGCRCLAMVLREVQGRAP